VPDTTMTESPHTGAPSPSAALKGLLSQGAFKTLPAEYAASMGKHVNQLIGLINDADAALRAGGNAALDLAARKVVEGRRLTGHDWRKYLAGSGAAARAGAEAFKAFQKDAEPLVSEIARLLAALPVPAIERCEGGFVLGCAACSGSAVTFRPRGSGFCARNISNVNQTISWDGETARRLGELLEAGDTRALLDYFAAPVGPVCPAYCPSCGRAFCPAHYAVAEEWSDSWYSAGYVTCVLGHQREYE
jgi:hypothetical protein